MAFRNILVQLDNHRNCDSRLSIALSLAQQHRGRLLGLYGFELPEPPPISFALAEAYHRTTNGAAFERYERQRDGAFDDATQSEAAFFAAARRAGVPARWGLWPEKPKELIATVTEKARYADLSILGQADPEHPLFDTLATLPEMVMLHAGRPVLIVPYTAEAKVVGKRILVAWNESREAARAIADAMPLLETAEAVTVLTLAPEDETRQADPAQALADQLAQHGIETQALRLSARDNDAGELILSRAADLDCDLLVMGGYGHSRPREFILGGTTRLILQSMTVPVLMSH